MYLLHATANMNTVTLRYGMKNQQVDRISTCHEINKILAKVRGM